MQLFEYNRWAKSDWYTANPLEQLSPEQLADLAAQQNMTVDELKRLMTTPHATMTCPLCGQASTHLVQCKGCGGGSWSYDLEMAHGEDAIERLRQGLSVTLSTTPTGGEPLAKEAVQHAVSHAYQHSGCMVCTACWQHTLRSDIYTTCPLYLHSARILNTDRSIPFQALLLAVLDGEKAHDWVRRVFAYWTQHWNTRGETPEEKKAIAYWRAALLHGALGKPEEFLRQSVSAEQEVASLMRQLDIPT